MKTIVEQTVLPMLAAVPLLAAGCAVDASSGRGDWDDQWGLRHGGGRHATDAAADPMTVRVTSPELQFPQLLGREVVIHLRRDALGMGGGATPVGLNVNGPDRNVLAVRGVYRGQDGAWVRLERDGGTTLFLPIEMILAVEAATEQETVQPPEMRP